MTFGEKLKMARKSKGLTQQGLADLINVKHNSVSDWENDKYKPDIDSVQLLIDVLDIEPSYIMGTKTTEEYGSLIGEIMNEPFLLDMIEDYKRLSELDKKAIRQIISSLRNGRE
jgi:transcriptional regulator with XRE-family HTH domain